MKKYMLFRSAFVILFTAVALSGSAQKLQQKKINITAFQVVKDQNKVDINWSTDKMASTNYFEVEKSNDGKNFKTVAYVFGADPTKTDCDCYGCFDKISTNAKESYYRLKHVDTNGFIEFSEVKMIAFK
ncbi:MAG: hypothetical protein ACTHK0_03425 [Ginsengibacter sp.]